MKKFILLFLVSLSANAAVVPGNAPTATLSAPGANTAAATVTPGQLVTGCAASTSSGCFSIYSGGAVTNALFYPFYGGPGSAGTYSGPGQVYRVTTGKTAYCFNITMSDSVTQFLFQLAAATSVVARGDSTIVGGVYQCGATNLGCTGGSNTTANLPAVVPGVYQFTASTYAVSQPWSSTTSNFNVHMDCFEQ